MDYGCANAVYARRDVYQTSSDGSSSNIIDSWTKGMQGSCALWVF